MSPARLRRDRAERAERVDARLRSLFRDAVAATPSARGRTALVAVGGYGRAEMSPFSDVDVVLLHDPDLPVRDVTRLAEAVWYPLWDDQVPLDHAVRDTDTMRAVAQRDWRAATGMLDARHVAGTAALTRDLRSQVLTEWRRGARSRLPGLHAAWRQRVERAGELAQAAVPDLKDSAGGLRDGVLLRALVATWLVEVPHQEVEARRAGLLDVRDALHEAAGRRADRLPAELLPDVAGVLGTEPEALGQQVRRHGRRTAHLVDLTWRRLEQALAGPARAPGRRPGRARVRRPPLQPLGGGLARVGREVVLDRTARPAEDPLLVLRAAAEAAGRDLLLGPATTARLATSAVPPPEPWPPSARGLLVRLLGSGPGLVPVWEQLDHAGLVARWLPEWDGIRLRPSDSEVHRHTVDRHCVETCVQAAGRLGAVDRADLLVVAALLHDLGKGAGNGAGPGAVKGAVPRADHSVTGAAVAVRVALRWGFDRADAERIGLLVRHHLLLPVTAVRHDPADPATVAQVAAAVQDVPGLELLAELSGCDALSAGPAAWSDWRAELVRRLVAGVRAALDRTGPPSLTGPGDVLTAEGRRTPY